MKPAASAAPKGAGGASQKPLVAPPRAAGTAGSARSESGADADRYPARVNMQTRFRGKAHTFGDNVDTDMIVAGKYLAILDPAKLAKVVLENADPEFAKRVEKGDFIVAGENFGCGSSREHAPVGLKAAGVSVVLAESFARIFFRNAINLGLPVVECPGISKAVSKGDEIVVDIATGTIENIRTGKALVGMALPENMLEILEAGGLIGIVRRKLGLPPLSEKPDSDSVEL